MVGSAVLRALPHQGRQGAVLGAIAAAGVGGRPGAFRPDGLPHRPPGATSNPPAVLREVLERPMGRGAGTRPGVTVGVGRDWLTSPALRRAAGEVPCW